MNNNRLKIMVLPMWVVILLVAVWWVNVTTWHTRNNPVARYDINQKLRAITVANQTVLQQRNRLLMLYQRFLHHQPIGFYNLEWMIQKKYIHTLYFNPYSKQEWQKLFDMFKPVPVKAIVQRAALLSHYGITPLAIKANNFFKIVVSRPEYGWASVPLEQQQRKINWLQPYDIQYARYFTPQRAINDYFWLLNTAVQFKAFRHYRDKLLQQHKDMNQVNAPAADKLLNVIPPATASQYGNGVLLSFTHTKVMT